MYLATAESKLFEKVERSIHQSSFVEYAKGWHLNGGVVVVFCACQLQNPSNSGTEMLSAIKVKLTMLSFKEIFRWPKYTVIIS